MKQDIDKKFSEDYDKFLGKFSEYNLNFGGDSAPNCPDLLNNLNDFRIQLLNKYFYGENGEYIKYLNKVKTEMPQSYVQVVVDALSSAEKYFGINFPHKEDYVQIKSAESIVIEIMGTYDISASLWPQ